MQPAGAVPTVAQNEPMGHALQLPTVVAPSAVLYVPTLQEAQVATAVAAVAPE